MATPLDRHPPHDAPRGGPAPGPPARRPPPLPPRGPLVRWASAGAAAAFADLADADAGDAAVSAASFDSGFIVTKAPLAVVRPRDAAGAARVLARAAARGWRVAVQGRRHSQGGQSLSGGGVALDLSALDGVGEPRGGAVEAGGGALWRRVVAESLRRGMIPPVLTNNLDTTVGGTISTGGVGGASAFEGVQGAQVLELEAAVPDGRVLRCSPRRRRGLFDALRGGLGEVGVITAARLRVVPAPGRVVTERLAFDDAGAFMTALRRAARCPALTHLKGWCRHVSQRGEDYPAAFWEAGARWCHIVHASGPAGPGVGSIPAAARLGARRRAEPLVQRPGEFADTREEHPRRPQLEPDLVCPVTEAWVPWDRAEAGLFALLESLPDALAPLTNVMIWPLAAGAGAPGVAPPPLLTLPRVGFAAGVGFIPYIPRRDADALLPAVADLGRRLVRMGGRRYLAGWTPYGPGDWPAHYGDRWAAFRAAKEEYDPGRVLGGYVAGL